MHLTVYFFSRYTIGKSIPLLSCLLLLPSNSTLVNFFSPSPHGNGTSPATDRSETTDNYTLLFEPCFEKFEKDRSEGRKGGRESRFNCFTDGRKKLPSSSSFSSSSLCPFERRLEHERSSSRQSFGAANIGHSVVFCARREHHRWGIPSRVWRIIRRGELHRDYWLSAVFRRANNKIAKEEGKYRGSMGEIHWWRTRCIRVSTDLLFGSSWWWYRGGWDLGEEISFWGEFSYHCWKQWIFFFLIKIEMKSQLL